MLIERDNRKWSIDFINNVLSVRSGLERIEEFLLNKTVYYPSAEEDPYNILTYNDMIWDDPSQNICRPNEVVLSINFVGYEEEMQVLTYEDLRQLVDEVKESSIDVSSTPVKPKTRHLPKCGRVKINQTKAKKIRETLQKKSINSLIVNHAEPLNDLISVYVLVLSNQVRHINSIVQFKYQLVVKPIFKTQLAITAGCVLY